MSLPDFSENRRPLYLFLIAVLAVGALASVFTAPAIPAAIPGWYASLNRPSFAPPGWALAPVSTALQIAMAFAAWRVWRKSGLKSPEMVLFALQLALNFVWSVLFFGLHQIGAALFEIAVLDVVILATLFLFYRRDRLAGLLFLPYLAWALFATFLTRTFWQLNQ